MYSPWRVFILPRVSQVFLSLFRSYPIAVWPLICAIIILSLVLMGPDVRDALKFHETWVAQGEWWRWVSAHWAHLGWQHGLLNGAGFLLLAWLNPRGPIWAWALFYLSASLLISAHLQFNLRLGGYVGASGVLHGLLILGAWYSQWLEPLRRWAMVLLISAKLVYEQTPFYSDADIASAIGGHVVVDAHLIGGVCALAWLLIHFFYSRHRRSQTQLHSD